MLETGFAQLRFAASLVFGTRLSLHSLQQTQREFGVLSAEGRDLLAGPTLDEESHRTIQLRRFRSQAVRAACEMAYYQRLFERLGLDPGRLRHEIAGLLLTLIGKQALDAFPHRLTLVMALHMHSSWFSRFR